MEHNKHHFLGLTDSQILENRKKYGQNILTPPRKESWIKDFLNKFKDPIIIILLIALVFSTLVAFYEFYSGHAGINAFFEPIGILLAVLLATVIGFLFEQNANKKFEILNKVNDDTLVSVIRNENVSEIPRKDIVVDDIIILEAGCEVPADGILLDAVSLQINESTLTGEPVVGKTTDTKDFETEATYPSNQAMKGTIVVDGHGILKVLKVGDATEYGSVFQGVQIDNSIETPLNKQLNKLAKLITKISYAIAILVVLGRLAWYFVNIADSFDWILFGSYFLSTIMIAVTIVVVAVPEGLPMSVTLSLALSMKRMLSANNLVRKMHACETMGATTVICTDKTGTLTQNQMRVYEPDFYDLDRNRDLIKESISVNSTAFLDYSDKQKIKPIGNPTEGALLLWLHDQGINYLTLREESQIIQQLTFSTETKYMATLVKSSLLSKNILYVKGAPEIVLDLCGYIPEDKDIIYNKLTNYQNKAMRTLGFAYAIVEGDEDCFVDGKIDISSLNLIFQGIVAISDPVRPEVPSAIEECINAGIKIKIITGDTPNTAKEIGRQIRLWTNNEPEGHHLTGIEFAKMSDEELLKRVLDLKIISRARPMDKQRLVELLQKKDQVVAVTGDGTNDAPALKAAQVGLSMGDGTSVAKEASDITIIDNSFSSISRAVMWGRSLYQNIQRFIIFQMTINVVACIIVLIGAFIGTESPLTVTQMLWVNLIMDSFAAMALASLPPDKGVMLDKPRNTSDFIITNRMSNNILGVGLFFVFLLFGLMQYFKHNDIYSLTEFSFSGYIESFFSFQKGNGFSAYEMSLFFTIFVMLQFWNMFNAKAFMTGKSALSGLSKDKGFIAIALLIVVGQWLIVTFGREMFSVVPISFKDWFLIIIFSSTVLWIGEVIRIFKKRTKTSL